MEENAIVVVKSLLEMDILNSLLSLNHIPNSKKTCLAGNAPALKANVSGSLQCQLHLAHPSSVPRGSSVLPGLGSEQF